MSFQFDTIHMRLLLIIAVMIAGASAYAAFAKFKARREERKTRAITAAIIEYFRKTGVQVTANCTRFSGKKNYTALIESEPMKRFRLSHIIEMTVREHIRKTCGEELEKIYWRFPIRKDAVEGEDKPAESDDYINEGLEHYRHIPKVEATELPWEQFEQATIPGIDSDRTKAT